MDKIKKILKSRIVNYLLFAFMIYGFVYLFFVNNNPDAVKSIKLNMNIIM